MAMSPHLRYNCANKSSVLFSKRKPQLKYAVHSWSLNYIKDQKLLEAIQKRATEHTHIGDIIVRATIKSNISLLYGRKIRRDLIEVVKMKKKSSVKSILKNYLG